MYLSAIRREYDLMTSLIKEARHEHNYHINQEHSIDKIVHNLICAGRCPCWMESQVKRNDQAVLYRQEQHQEIPLFLEMVSE